jgi:predicted Zn-dependent peptidase
MKNLNSLGIACALTLAACAPHNVGNVGALPPANENYSRFTHEVLPNGLELIISQNRDSRVFAINILGKNRAANEPEGKAGITDFVNRMLTLGADGMNAEEIQNRLNDIGAEITANDNPYIPYDDRYTTRSFSFVKFETIDDYAEQGTRLLHTLISKADFPEDEIAKTKKKAVGIFGMSSSSTYQVCRDLMYGELFKGHPFANPVMGSMATVGSFTRDDLVAHHRHFYAPNNMIIAIGTNLDTKFVKEWVYSTFGTMPRDESSYAFISAVTKPAGLNKTHQDMDKEQVYIYMGMITPGLISSDAPAIHMAAAIISARMGLNLREKQGLAYSVGMDVDFMPEFGWAVAAMGTGFQNLDIATTGLIEQINLVKTGGCTEQELQKAQNSTWGSMLLARASRINQTFYICRNQFLGVGYDYENDYLSKVKKVTPADIKRVAAGYFDTDNMVVATVGKKRQ